MKLVIFEDAKYENFYPLAYSRAVFELKCGWRSLADKIESQIPSAPVGYFCRDWIEPTFKRRTEKAVNDLGVLKGDDLLIVNGRLICNEYRLPVSGPSEQASTAAGDLVYLRLEKKDLPQKVSSLDELIKLAGGRVKKVAVEAPLAEYAWDLMLINPAGLRADFKAAGKFGIEGTVEQPNAIRGSKADVYIAPGVVVHPFVCIDAANGPVYIDRDAEVHPYTRIEGPAYIGPKSILLGTKLREGCTIGPVCRVGGEVEESIIHGYSNKYHDGFLGHAYVGEWVNLGALTTNSDLKNDYTSVDVTLNGKKINTGSTKVGSMIGDHTKTSIGALFNTGSICGAMCLVMASGQPLPKSIPSFAWMINGVATKGFGKKALYDTAKTAMSRRKMSWTEQDEALWDKVFDLTADERDNAIKRGRRQLLKS
jgi:UDP-N-acetylglucosamine diphosphorylase/glucosamine-1-phosphate N-acetyltransferase